MNLEMQKVGYEAALAATAKALQPTLLDFLRMTVTCPRARHAARSARARTPAVACPRRPAVPPVQVLSWPSRSPASPATRTSPWSPPTPPACSSGCSPSPPTVPRFLAVPAAPFFPDTRRRCPAPRARARDSATRRTPLYCLVTVPDGDVAAATANLRAPLVVNPATQRARQIVLTDGAHPIRRPLRR